MPPVRPMLDDVELQNVQQIFVDDKQVLARHDVPALENDFWQRLERHGYRVRLSGVLTGIEARDKLKTLREKYYAAVPVSFVADIATATRIDQVLIAQMTVRELAGKPERFEYVFSVCEYREYNQPGSRSGAGTTAGDAGAATAQPVTVGGDGNTAGSTTAGQAALITTQPDAANQTDPSVDEAIAADAQQQVTDTLDDFASDSGSLRVVLEFAEGLEADLTNLVVVVEGTNEAGDAIHFIIEDPQNGVFIRDDIPAGSYSVSVMRR